MRACNNVVRMPRVEMNLIKQKTVQKQPKVTPPTKVAMSRDTLIQPRSTSASVIAEICIRLAWLHQRHWTAIFGSCAHACTEHIAVHYFMQQRCCLPRRTAASTASAHKLSTSSLHRTSSRERISRLEPPVCTSRNLRL